MKNIRLLTIIAAALTLWMGYGRALAADVIDAKDATIAWAFDKSADNASPATVSVPEAISSTSHAR